MNEYLFRKAVVKDIPFLADVIISAEKGKSDKLSYSTLFNISESRARELIISMLEEEIDGCELSLSSFWVAEYGGEPVAASGSWIESFNGLMPSQILKSNLISYFYERESIEFLKARSHMLKGILADREPMTLQFEYMHISDEHVGKGIDAELVKKNEEYALAQYPALKKAQCQVFKNNIFAVKVALKRGYKIVKSYKSVDDELFNYLPFNEKVLMEKLF